MKPVAPVMKTVDLDIVFCQFRDGKEIFVLIESLFLERKTKQSLEKKQRLL
jgi:hypothetical protein